LEAKRANAYQARIELLELPWPAVKALSRDTPVVLPIAALQRHGRHVPDCPVRLPPGEVLRCATAGNAG